MIRWLREFCDDTLGSFLKMWFKVIAVILGGCALVVAIGCAGQYLYNNAPAWLLPVVGFLVLTGFIAAFIRSIQTSR